MYTPAPFSQTDTARIEHLIAAFPLAALVAATPDGLVVNHVPLLRDGDGFVGHVALANPVHGLLTPEAPVVAIFAAGDGYVSPNWYPSKARTHQAVPTWNYRVAHVHGHLCFSHAERDKRRAVALLTRHHEGRVNGAADWRMGDAPAAYLQSMLDSIVALRLSVTRIEAKDKLNQNRGAGDIASVATQMEARGLDDLARAMRAVLPKA